MFGRLFFLLLGPFCLVIFAAAGSVIFSEGQVLIQRAGTTFGATAGTNIESGDVISTGKGAKVRIRFSDGSLITAGRESQLRVNDYINTGDRRSKMNVGMVKGFFRSVTGTIGKVAPQRFKIQSTTSTIGVRGTTIVAQIQPYKMDTIACADGMISVMSLGTRREVNVSVGQITQVQYGKSPTIPRPYTQDEFNALDPDSSAIALANVVLDKTEEITDATDTFADFEMLDDLEEQSSELLTSSTLDLIDNDLVPVDDTLESQSAYTIDSDPYMSWGYWVGQNSDGEYDVTDPASIEDVWFEGTTTSTSYIDDLIEGTAITSFVYSGSNVFGVAGGEFINSGNVQLKFDLGGNSASFDSANSYLQFSTSSDTWHVENLSGTVSGSGFSSSSFDTGAASTVSGISGNVKGNFFGSSAEEVGGSFELSGGGKNAIGGFTGSR